LIAQRLRSDWTAIPGFRTDPTEISHQLRSDCTTIARRLPSGSTSIPRRLLSDCSAIPQRLPSDSAAIVQRLRSDCPAIAQRLRCDGSLIAEQYLCQPSGCNDIYAMELNIAHLGRHQLQELRAPPLVAQCRVQPAHVFDMKIYCEDVEEQVVRYVQQVSGRELRAGTGPPWLGLGR
jgi:hypothetical protein